MKVDKAKFDQYTEDGWLVRKKHPFLDYYIYNYSIECQFKRHWDEITSICRGLVLDGEGNIIARPFPKFFNYEEHINLGQEIPEGWYKVFNKEDGSLGISYPTPAGGLCLTTRGSFESEQAIRGTRMLQEHFLYDELDRKNYTYLFEIIYPENRIVLDYKGEEKLILLAKIEIETGKTAHIPLNERKFKTPRRTFVLYPNYFTKDKDYFDVGTTVNREGFVFEHIKTHFRFKLKFEDYVRLHRTLSGLNEKAVWQVAMSGQDVEEFKMNLPEEFGEWFGTTHAKFMNDFETIEALTKSYFNFTRDELIKRYGDEKLIQRKPYALTFKELDYPAVLFAMLDGKPYDHIIWKIIKPVKDKDAKNDTKSIDWEQVTQASHGDK